MLRQSDIRSAFMNSISQNPKGYSCLHTCDFIRELRSRGIHLSGEEANRWIERNQIYFVDKSTSEGENRLWLMRNMGRVI
ncbi:TPA: hypothetical protein MHT80_04105 [Klebsiella pneumoniae]|nr:hypothetical protein [Klebsiella pneumoniae]